MSDFLLAKSETEALLQIAQNVLTVMPDLLTQDQAVLENVLMVSSIHHGIRLM